MSIKDGGPRERLQRSGAVSLSEYELLQVLIGSGNAQASVGRIARRLQRVLVRSGAGVGYDDVLRVAGLGEARACQVVAAFELASRYPARMPLKTIDTAEKEVFALTEVRQATVTRCAVVTLDGALRQIQTRSCLVRRSRPVDLLRQVLSWAIRDDAAHIAVGMGHSSSSLEPSLFELLFVRDLRASAKLLHIGVRGVYLMNRDATFALGAEA